MTPLESGSGDDPIQLVPYDPSWPDQFTTEASRLRGALKDIALRVEHIGSTAVPGLAAKPVIDVQISVPALEPSAPYVRPLESLGYGNWRDVHEPDHRFCRDDPRRHHVHLVIAGGVVEPARPLLRDYLVAHPYASREYATLKLRAAATHGHDRDAYTRSKNEFVAEMLHDASAWATRTGWAL